MDKTPVSKSKLLRKFSKVSEEEKLNEQANDCLEDNSENSMQIPFVEEDIENMDVGWDWNSPQAKPKLNKAQKRRNHLNSPKISLKRHQSKESFEKLKEELRALREEMARPENEECLRLSPLDEDKFKNCDRFLNNEDNVFQDDVYGDFFDNTLDEQLLACTKQIEDKLEKSKLAKSSNSKTLDQSDRLLNLEYVCDPFESMVQKLNERKAVNPEEKTKFKFKTATTMLTTPAGKVEFHRTQSFEESSVILSKSKLDEIERKRQEAMAKLASKKNTGCYISPPPCSLEEIERKRLQALAKIEAKQQAELIERKRQEAIKRLENSRMRNVKSVKSSLTSRLN